MKMSKKVAFNERGATESIPKKDKTGGLYQRWSKREGQYMWCGQFVYHGRKYRTAAYPTKTEAKDALDRLRVEVRQQGRKLTREKATFAKFRQEFLEDAKLKNRNHRRAVIVMKHMMPFFGDQKLADIAPPDINRYISKRLKNGVKPATVNRERACLSRMFNVAIRLGKASHNPVVQVEKLREENRRSRIMTDEEFARLVQTCEARPNLRVLKPYLIVARLTCMRRGELLNLRKEDVDFTRGRYGIITIRKSKSGTPKVIFISELLSRYMKRLVLESPDEYVLEFNRSGDYLSRFEKLWTQRLLKYAGVQGLWFHDIRRTGSTVLYETTGDVYAAKDMLGHSSVDVTERYLVTGEESRQEAAEALASGQKIRQILEFEIGTVSQVQ